MDRYWRTIEALAADGVEKRFCLPVEETARLWLRGLAFKIVSDQHGELTYVRVYSGKLQKGSRVLNSNRNKKENISRLFQMHAADRIAMETAEAGERAPPLPPESAR